MRKLALYLIRLLTPLTYSRVTAGSVSQLIEPVKLPDGKPLVLEYLGKSRRMYRYRNENDGKIARLIWLKIFDQEKDLNISLDLLNKYLDSCLQLINEHDLARVANNLVMLKDSINNCTPVDVLYNQAAILLFDEDEDLGRYDADRNHAKVKAMKAYLDEDFFLTMLLKLLGFSGEESLSDILSYLKKSKVKLAAYQRILSESKDLTDTTGS